MGRWFQFPVWYECRPCYAHSKLDSAHDAIMRSQGFHSKYLPSTYLLNSGRIQVSSASPSEKASRISFNQDASLAIRPTLSLRISSHRCPDHSLQRHDAIFEPHHTDRPEQCLCPRVLVYSWLRCFVHCWHIWRAEPLPRRYDQRKLYHHSSPFQWWCSPGSGATVRALHEWTGSRNLTRS